jgi:hypothetical protein
MPHPEIHDHTRLSHAIVPLNDEQGAPVLAVILQASFRLSDDGLLSVIDPQPPVEIGGDAWPCDASAGEIEWRLEPQTAFVKPGCDLVLHGHARGPARGCRQMMVSFSVGPTSRQAMVFGRRHMLDGRRITAPEFFDRIALRYANAFGGWDRRHPDTSCHAADRRNPLGRGWRDPAQPTDAELEMPALEDPAALLERYGATPAPVGFGFTSGHWSPRSGLAGTYDAAWLATRMPLLPMDFDRRFFLAASRGLQAPAPLQGGETVSVVGTTARGRLDFLLPQLGTPLFHAHMRGQRRLTLKLQLDTVIVDTDLMQLTLTWRHPLALRNGLHDLVAGEFHLPDPRAKRLRTTARVAAPRG